MLHLCYDPSIDCGLSLCLHPVYYFYCVIYLRLSLY